jgi:hypothetical protein
MGRTILSGRGDTLGADDPELGAVSLKGDGTPGDCGGGLSHPGQVQGKRSSQFCAQTVCVTNPAAIATQNMIMRWLNIGASRPHLQM